MELENAAPPTKDWAGPRRAAPQSLSFSVLETTNNPAGQTRTLSGAVIGGVNAAGLTIHLETSPNLRDWIPSGTQLADPTGTISFNFLQSQQQNTFFLRTRLP